jgi:WS/DGAT/MGAT family acyltransferase
MMICGVLTFRECIDLRRLRKTVEQRFLRFKRFRDIRVSQPAMSFWHADTGFDLDHHVVHVALPGRGGKRELQTMISRLASTPLNPARPLWQFHLVDNYAGGSALVARIHHCYADGIALVQVMLSMTDAAPNGPPALPPPPRRQARAGKGDVSTLLAQPFAGAMQTALKIGATMIEKGVAIWQDPAKAVALAEQGGALTSELARLAMMRQDSPTRFKGMPGIAKRVAWADPLPLPEVKAVGKALDASVNDVLLSCVAGALREYLVEKGDSVADVSVRALVPVNLRPLEKAYRLGNQFGLVFLDLPLGIANPVARLYAVRENMRALKGSYQPVLTLGLLAAVGAGPKLLQDQLLQALSRNGTAVMTNVPGPQVPLYVAGAKIEGFMFWVPQAGDIGMGVSILSYNGTVQFGLITDRGLVPDPEGVIRRFRPEFDKLVLTALMAPPWTGDLDPAVAARAAGVDEPA